ncbi:hypothetical protein SO802_015024 [Lithocarpus litseifolius]|uniref:Reverse transcriptase domain-containing protein n=1 Tax=Lithocarpus litseifolius TaxID=425828 RepID=A0AAW2CUP0_9ROSI
MELFKSDHCSVSLADWNPPFWHSYLNEEEAASVDIMVTVEEISAGLWGLKPYKAPSPDGLHVRFFQCFWLVVGDSVKNEMVTKIIVARIQSFLSKLVSPFQPAFVPGRKGMDNAIIVQEIIHTMARKKGNGRVMVIKLDLEKAYDRLEWSFIRDTLKLFRIPNNLISLIMSCISSSAISILFNWGALEAYQPSRGIQQDRKNCIAIRDVLDTFCSFSGQKISEEKSWVYFSPNVEQNVREELSEVLGFRSTLALGKYLGFFIKHKGTPQDFGFIINRVQSKLAGWKENLLSFAGRIVLTQSVTSTIPNYTREELSEVLGFRSTLALGKYLGFFIKHKGTPQDFGFIINRIQSKLAGWKENLLSFAGRIVLTQSVTSTIPNYTMQCVALPPKILKGIDRLNMNFLRGSSDSKKKLHLIG